MNMFFTEKKLKARINELAPYRYLNRTPIGGWQMMEDTTKEMKYPPEKDENWQDFPVGSRWEGRDYYLWIQTELEVPILPAEEDFLLLFYFGQTGGGHNSGFESLLFINGEPYQGVDSNHPEVFIDTYKYGGKTIKLAIKLWSGLEGGGPPQVMSHQFLYGDYALLSPEIDDLYYTSQVMLDTILLLKQEDPTRVALLNILDQTFNKIDWTNGGDEAFDHTIELANQYLKEELKKLPKNTPVTITTIGHTHIDVAWLWRLKHTREKSARSFSTVLRLMERYPEYIFLQSQPQLYAYIKEDYPEIYEKIKEKVSLGKWEVDGAMWVEADCNISSGESLVRQIFHGARFIRQEFGKTTKYLWLPDVFGYSWALPQILKKAGIDTFMTTKISWNQYNRMPHDTFIWRGIDGSEVLTHFITTPEPGADLNQPLHRYTYNGVLEPSTVKGIYDSYRNKDFNSNLLLSYGYGDGGGGVNREMLEKRRRLDEMPGIPQVKTGQVGEFFDTLHETVRGTKNYVHTWDGELYLEYHRGTYTSQAFVKKWNRRLELALREMEMLHTWALAKKSEWVYPQDKIYQGWETVLRNQFHDIIPGSSITEVYEDAQVEYQGAWDLMTKAQDEFVKEYQLASDTIWTVYNTAGWARAEEILFIPIQEKGYFKGGNGQMLASKKTAAGYYLEMERMEAFSSRVIMFVPDDDPEEDLGESGLFELEQTHVETHFYKVEWNEAGQLTSIWDKRFEREVLKEGGLGNYLRIFEDKPMQFDAWDIDLYYIQKSKTLTANKIEVTANDAFFVRVEFTYEFGKSNLVQEMVLYRGNARIDFKTKVNWQERQQLLRASFDVDIRATEATYQIQYGNVKRPTHWNTSWDMARFETVAHQWVDFGERDYGVALLNDCKYGHNVKDQTISLSLLKGAISPDPTADLGEHEFTYSLLPHEGDFIAGKVTEEAWDLNNPLQAYPGDGGQSVLLQVAAGKSGEEAVMVDAFKKKEDGEGFILRLHDHMGSKRKITIKPKFVFSNWQETNLLEEPIGEKQEFGEGEIYLELNPYEVKTILIKKAL